MGVQGNINGNYTANIVSMEYYPVVTLLGWIFPSLKISKRCMISVELKGMWVIYLQIGCWSSSLLL